MCARCLYVIAEAESPSSAADPHHEYKLGHRWLCLVPRAVQIVDLIDAVPPRSRVSEGGEETTAIDGGGEEAPMETRPSGSSGSLESEVSICCVRSRTSLIGVEKIRSIRSLGIEQAHTLCTGA